MDVKTLLIPMPLNDLDQAYLAYKDSLFEVVEDTFGWNEEFQIERFRSLYKPEWFHYIEIDSQRVGYICFWETSEEFHISLLIIDPEKRGKAYGSKAMLQVERLARLKNSKVTLSRLSPTCRLKSASVFAFRLDSSDYVAARRGGERGERAFECLILGLAPFFSSAPKANRY